MSTIASLHRTRSHKFGIPGIALTASLFTFAGCDDGAIEHSGDADQLDADQLRETSCDPTMTVFPVASEHNIGFDKTSCKMGICELSCPDANSNSDWGMKLSGTFHHGSDIYAEHGVPIVAVTSGTIKGVGVSISKLGLRSTTSGIRVRLRDECGWEYYYGHLDEAVVSKNQHVEAGELIGYLGSTGSTSTNLHFNVSPEGLFNSDIDPFALLTATSPTACDGDEPASQTPPPEGCVLGVDQALQVNESLTSCNGQYTLSMQLNGNLVLSDANDVDLWSSQTAGGAGQAVVMKGDGNFAMVTGYDGTGTSVWETSTTGHPGATLSVEDDGNLRIYEGMTAIWTAL